MRQITEIMTRAFFNGERKTLSNTTVKNHEMYLFDNKIAWIENNKLYFTMCGWNTQTTRERLNGLGVRISQRNFEPYFNGEKIDSKKIYSIDL